MERSEKEAVAKSLHERLTKSKIAFLTRFTGMQGNQISLLRQNLRKKGAKYKVVKNTLARLAVKGTAFEGLKDHFKNPVGLVTSDADPVGPTKVLKEFVKDETIPFSILMGFMDGKVLSERDLNTLADMPSREEMLSKLLGSMQAPAQNLVNVMAAVPRQLVTVLAAIRDQKSKNQ